jgi:hypothetical protein
MVCRDFGSEEITTSAFALHSPASGGCLAFKGMSAVPHPPFPNPDSQILKLIVNNAIGAMQSGEVDAEGAILHAAVHAWYEGHIEGEDVCPGCAFRGDMPHQRHKMINPDLN